jgi:hypothetical protein
METFYLIVLTVAVSILILLLAFYGIFINSAVKNVSAYPPQPAPACPDYWTLNPDGTCKIPIAGTSAKNVGGIYDSNGNTTLTAANTPGFKSTPGSIDFSNKDWSKGGGSAICRQKSWANGANVMWDGVSNYNGC